MISIKGHGHQSPAHEGVKISATPTQSADSQGRLGGNATCDGSQRLSPGPLERTVTGDTTVSGLFTAAQPTRGTTPCVGGPPPTVPQGPSAKTFRRRAKKQAKACNVAGTSTQPVPSTSLQLPDHPSMTLEAMETGVLDGISGRLISSLLGGRGSAACWPLGGGSR